MMESGALLFKYVKKKHRKLYKKPMYEGADRCGSLRCREAMAIYTQATRSPIYRINATNWLSTLLYLKAIKNKIEIDY